jgi:hypothetical protein
MLGACEHAAQARELDNKQLMDTMSHWLPVCAGLIPLLPGISDIDQLARMQSTLGSITLEDWPEAEQLPDWHKIAFAPCQPTPWQQLLPCAPQGALELVAQLLRWVDGTM